MRFLSSRFTLALATGALAMGLSMPAGADSGVSRFATQFDKVADNCKGVGMQIDRASVTVTQDDGSLEIKIDELPELTGKVGRRGKLRAEGKGSAKTPGVSARYGFNGRIAKDELQAVFVAEYFRSGKPICTQSFSASGKRSST